MTYLKVKKMFKQGTDNLKLDYKNSIKGLTESIKRVRKVKGSTRYKELLIDP